MSRRHVRGPSITQETRRARALPIATLRQGHGSDRSASLRRTLTARIATGVLLALVSTSACQISHRPVSDNDVVFAGDATLPDATDVGAVHDGSDVGPKDAAPDATCSAPAMLCNGKCVPVDRPERCGSCLNDCRTLPGVIQAGVQCRSGRCDLTGACAPSRADCNSDPADGCEADTDLPRTCGSGCSRCPEPPASGRARCMAGACTVECDVGFRASMDRCVPMNCGNRSLDGTETCDDGNNTSGDGCSEVCQMEANTLREDCAGLSGALVIRLPTGRSVYTGTTDAHTDEHRGCGMGGPDAMMFFMTPTGYSGALRVELRARTSWDIVLLAGTTGCPGNCIDPGHDTESFSTTVTAPTMVFVGADSHGSSTHGPYVLTFNLP